MKEDKRLCILGHPAQETCHPQLVLVLVLLRIVSVSLHRAVPVEDSLTVMLNSQLMTHHQTQSHCYLCPMERTLWLWYCHP